jgi:hypothetical protein
MIQRDARAVYSDVPAIVPDGVPEANREWLWYPLVRGLKRADGADAVAYGDVGEIARDLCGQL